ncbi:MAG: TlpA family protein disulfide reductase [Cocleimonas sp.]|nr:TlpA family protein disulfide reductase [Cocleimonas sp.]
MSTLLSISGRHLIIMLLFLSLCLSTLLTHANTPAKNQLVNDIAFNDIHNKKHHLSDYRGQWLILNFWAGYCSICQKEAPTLIRFQQQHKNKVTLLGINYGGESKQKIKEAMLRNRYNYLIVPDQKNITKIFNDVIGTPTTIIISPQGRLIKKAVGQQSYQELLSYINTPYPKENEPHIWDREMSNK